MQIIMKAAKPEDIEFTLLLTMTLKEWEVLSAQLGDKYPAWKIGAAISDMQMQARKIFDSPKSIV